MGVRFPLGTLFGVRLAVVGDGLEAELICGLLRTAGMACNHRQLNTGIGAWEAVGIDGQREVLVGQDDLEAAEAIVADERRAP